MDRRVRIAAASWMLLAALGGPAAAQGGRLTVVPVFVNGERLEANAVLVGNGARALLPLRALFHALDVRVAWDEKSRSVYAFKPDGQGIRLRVGERRVQLRKIVGEPGAGNWGTPAGARALDAPPLLIGGTVYIPLRAASESLQAEVRWDGTGRRVLVSTQNTPEAAPEKPARALQAALILPKERFAPGEAVPLKLVVKNESAKAVAAHFRSGQQFDFEVRQNGRVLWTWSHGRFFTQALGGLVFQPGESKSFEARWQGVDDGGQPLAAGAYVVRGVLTASDEAERVSAERKITIGP